MSTLNPSAFLETMANIGQEAGNRILAIKHSGALKHMEKLDKSLVSNADQEAENYILDALRASFGQDILIIGEESVAAGRTLDPGGSPFWLIDPLDGTHPFLKGSDYYCVCIAYLENRLPIAGCIHIPATGETYFGRIGEGAYKRLKDGTLHRIMCRPYPADHAVALCSGYSTIPDVILQKYHITTLESFDSAIKFCHVAEGRVDAYVRVANLACEWDIAAGHALILAAGGEAFDFDGRFPSYGHPEDSYRFGALIAKGR